MFGKFCIYTILLVSYVKCNDIHLGYPSPNSRKIFSEIKEANPALWKRSDDVIINAPANEVISSVVVTDLRDGKDGEAYIGSGGIGDKSITIGLKSPSILRGYKFELEVYSNDPNSQYYSKGGSAIYYPNSYPVKF